MLLQMALFCSFYGCVIFHCMHVQHLLYPFLHQFNSIQSSHSVNLDSWQPHGLRHARPPCPSPTPGAYSSSCPLSQWCLPTTSSSVVLFSSCLQSFSASESFQMSQFFASGGQSVGVSASTSVLPVNIQDWFPLGWTGLDLLAVHSSVSGHLLRFLPCPSYCK